MARVARKRLQKALRRCGAEILRGRGRGSHWCARRKTKDGVQLYPFPDQKDYPRQYVEGARRKLKLTIAEGFPDEMFYGR